MMKQQSGFTLIELIMVIVVLGALAVTALPKYVDLEASAQQGAVEGIAGALAAGSAINFSACKAGSADCLPTAGGSYDDCRDVVNTVEGGVSADYAITPTTAFVAGAAPSTCTIAGTGTPVPATVTTTFTAFTP